MGYDITDMINDSLFEHFGDVTTDAAFKSSNIEMTETKTERGEYFYQDEVWHQHIEDTVTGKKITLRYTYGTRVTCAEKLIKAWNNLIVELEELKYFSILEDTDMWDIYEDYDLETLESKGIITINKEVI